MREKFGARFKCHGWDGPYEGVKFLISNTKKKDIEHFNRISNTRKMAKILDTVKSSCTVIKKKSTIFIDANTALY